MRPDSLFWIEIMEDSRRRRSLVFKFALPVALVLPLSLADVPVELKHATLPLLVLFMGVLGSSVGLSSLRERGMLERLSTLPVTPAKMVSDYVMANVAMDALQIMLPAVILFVALEAGALAIAYTAIGLVLCILISNSLGVLMAIAARGAGEVHLYSGVCVLLVGGVSGLFMGNAEGLMDAIQTGLPFSLVSSVLSGMTEGEGIHLIASAAVTVLVLAGAIGCSASLFKGKEG